MRRVLFVAVIAVALSTAAVAFAATTLSNPADKIKLAYAKKALTAKPGKITLKMFNPSPLQHDISLRAGVSAKAKILVKGQTVGEGGTSKITVTLKPGKYRFFCTVPGHEAGGMWGILTVK